jgi:hypothetical protein
LVTTSEVEFLRSHLRASNAVSDSTLDLIQEQFRILDVHGNGFLSR